MNRIRMTMAAALLAASAPAQAQEFGEILETISPREMAFFSDCRAAVFFHLDAGEDQQSAVPLPVARSLLDQINFIMGELITGRPPRSVDEQRAIVDFTEQFFINFNRTIARNQDAMRDVARREAVLMECIPWVWTTVRLQIDKLVDWRRKTSNTPPAFTAEESQRMLDSTSRRLGIGTEE
jgi:hypothetical protein